MIIHCIHIYACFFIDFLLSRCSIYFSHQNFFWCCYLWPIGECSINILSLVIFFRGQIQKISLGGSWQGFFSHQYFWQRAVGISLEKQLGPRGPIVSPRGSVLIFLMKPIATCALQRGEGDPLSPPKPPGIAHVFKFWFYYWFLFTL